MQRVSRLELLVLLCNELGSETETNHFTFYEVAQTRYNKVRSEYCSRVDVVLDVYKEYPIRNAKRINECRTSNTTKFKNTIGGHIIKKVLLTKLFLLTFFAKNGRNQFFKQS